jgi:sugar O-acyltransferase (sialic acid O-acetyltransferase NeuD family)
VFYDQCGRKDQDCGKQRFCHFDPDRMKKILIIGAGGHGQVIADILWRRVKSIDAVQLLGYLDDDVNLLGKRFADLEVLGPVSAYTLIPHDAVIVAIGDNRTRQRVSSLLRSEGEAFISAVHPSAILGQDSRISPGAMICAGVVVGVGACIGAHAILNTACSVDHHNQIGDFAHIAPGCHTGGEVTVEEGALVGLSACLLPRIRIGAWSIIGGGAVVLHDMPAGVVAHGHPCRVVKSRGVI